MEAEIELRPKRLAPLDARYTVSIDFQTKCELEKLKTTYHLDINEMIRDFLEKVIKKTKGIA